MPDPLTTLRERGELPEITQEWIDRASIGTRLGDLAINAIATRLLEVLEERDGERKRSDSMVAARDEAESRADALYHRRLPYREAEVAQKRYEDAEARAEEMLRYIYGIRTPRYMPMDFAEWAERMRVGADAWQKRAERHHA
ncbi:MAG: hypothetical protein ACLQUT_05335 [Thermoleophilia bacterium]